eukprot:1147252-Pelagomonas_calceolata.AAC.4
MNGRKEHATKMQIYMCTMKELSCCSWHSQCRPHKCSKLGLLVAKVWDTNHAAKLHIHFKPRLALLTKTAAAHHEECADPSLLPKLGQAPAPPPGRHGHHDELAEKFHHNQPKHHQLLPSTAAFSTSFLSSGCIGFCSAAWSCRRILPWSTTPGTKGPAHAMHKGVAPVFANAPLHYRGNYVNSILYWGVPRSGGIASGLLGGNKTKYVLAAFPSYARLMLTHCLLHLRG